MITETLDELQLCLHKNSGQGFLLQVPEAVYRVHPYVSQSELKVFSSLTPAHYREQRVREKKDSDAMKLGTAIHTAILEPLEYEKKYLCGPDVDLRTKAGKTAWAKAMDVSIITGRELLEPEIYTPPLLIREKLRQSQFFNSIISDGVVERSLFGFAGGVWCKGRMDYFKPSTLEIIDLKSTVIAAPSVFEKDIRKYKYHWQAAFYIDLVKALTGQDASFKILAIEKSPPYGVSLQDIGFDLLAIARREIAKTQAELAACIASDYWPAYPETLHTHRAHEHEWKQFKQSIHASRDGKG